MIDCSRLGHNPSSRLRFRPPQLVPDEGVLWAVRRGLGALSARELPAPDGAVGVARRLDLGPRIASRVPRALLAADLGREGAAALQADRGVHALAADALLEAARGLAASGQRVALLKGAALIARGLVEAGARPLGDLDVLVPQAELAACAEGLDTRGFARVAGGVESDHQLPALVKDGHSVELHRFLPGVRVPGWSGFATFEALDAAGLLEPLEGWPPNVRVPSRAALVAHAAVHGLAQHGFAPRSYPLMRMLADLIDLGACADVKLGGAAHVLVSAEIPRPEWDELLDTCRELERGGGLERPLVAHAVLGLLDDDYAASLKLRALGAVPSLLPKPLAVAREAWRALFPGRERLAALLPGGRGLALKRPFVMLGRGLSAIRKRRA